MTMTFTFFRFRALSQSGTHLWRQIPAVARLAVALLLGLPQLTMAQTPSISIAFPAFRQSFAYGTVVPVRFNVTAPAGATVTKVELETTTSSVFTVHGESTTAPYTINWTVPSSGFNDLRGKVTFSTGATLTTSPNRTINGFAPTTCNTGANSKKFYVKAGAPVSGTGVGASAANPIGSFQNIHKNGVGGLRPLPGDTIFFVANAAMPYSLKDDNGFLITTVRTGREGCPIVISNLPNERPKLKFDGWNGVVIPSGVSYVELRGLDIEGNNSNITLAEAQQQPGACEGPNPNLSLPGNTPLAKFNGNGISIDGSKGGTLRPHHVVIADNIVHDCAGGGIGGGECDYVTIEKNIVYNTSWYTIYGTSGINIINAWNYDNNTTTPRIIIRNNRSFGNILKVAWNIGGTGTNCKFYDGNGIILDNNNAAKNTLGAYLGKFLIENNVSYLNGGRGINLNYSDNAIVLNNTTYQNGVSAGGAGVGIENEIIIQGATSGWIYNNIFHGRSGESINFIGGSTNIQHNNNLTFEGTGTPYFSGNQNITGQNPQFVDAANADFRLLQTSPAVNKGSSMAGQFAAKDFLGVVRPQGAGVDIGAYELQGVPITFTQQPASGATVCVGATVSPSVTVDGPGPITYQWKKDGVAIEGNASASTATLMLSSVIAADAGSYTVVVTAFNQLTSSAFVLTVNPLPSATLSGTTAVCQNATAPSVTFTGSGGTAPYTFTYSVNEGDAQTVTTTEGSSVTVSQPTGTAGSFSYSLSLVSDANCQQAVSGQSATVTVNALPTVNFSGLNAAYCVDASAVTLTGSPAGGTFSGTGISGSTFNPATSGVGGPHTITYSYTDANGCSNTSTQQVTVNALPTVSFSGLEASYCANASAVTLTGSPAGGTFAGMGISGTTFNPATAGVGGPYLITYSYTDGNGCSNTSPGQSVTVTQPVFTEAAALSVASLCAGSSLNLTFNVNCPINASFSAELTDALGTPLGISLGLVSPGSTSVSIPAGTPTGRYKILVTGTNPTLTSLSGLLAVTGLSANYGSTPTVSSTPACAGSTVRVSFTTRTASCPFPGGTVFTAELSDASGSFASPVSLGVVTAGINANVPIPQATPTGTGYRIRIAATAGGSSVYSASSAAFAVNQPSFAATPSVSSDNRCAGESVRLSFSVGCAFVGGNTFTAELSNASGSFAAPLSVGTVTPGAINNVLIPAGTPAGTGYKLRVVSSSPLVTSAASANFKAKACGNTREAAPEKTGLQVRVSPNPSPEGRLLIHVSGVEGQSLKVVLFNGLGQPVREQDLERASDEDVLEWDITRQPQGLYLLRVSGSDEVKTVKVIH